MKRAGQRSAAGSAPAAEPPGALVPGDVVGGYVVESVVAEGGMGVVYLATDADGRVCALKLIRGEVAHRADVRERFETEGRVLAELRHPCIVALYEVGTHAGQPYLAMEWIKGRTLGDVMALRRAPLPLWQALSIAVRIGSALVVAHAKGVVHRDLKPGNVILQKGGGLKVVDFGIAKMQGAAPTTDRLASMLTPAYAAPEQIERGVVDGRTDVFALAQILVEMATGRHAYVGQGETTPADDVVAALKRKAEPNRLIDNVPDCPPSLSMLVQRALSKEREHRPDAVTFVAGLRREMHAVNPDVVEDASEEDGAAAPVPVPEAPGEEPESPGGRMTLELAPSFTAADPLARFEHGPALGPRGTRKIGTAEALLAAQGKTLAQARADAQARERPASLPPPPASERRPTTATHAARAPSPTTSLPVPAPRAGEIPRASIEAPFPRASIETAIPRASIEAPRPAGLAPKARAAPAAAPAAVAPEAAAATPGRPALRMFASLLAAVAVALLMVLGMIAALRAAGYGLRLEPAAAESAGAPPARAGVTSATRRANDGH